MRSRIVSSRATRSGRTARWPSSVASLEPGDAGLALALAAGPVREPVRRRRPCSAPRRRPLARPARPGRPARRRPGRGPERRPPWCARTPSPSGAGDARRGRPGRTRSTRPGCTARSRPPPPAADAEPARWPRPSASTTPATSPRQPAWATPTAPSPTSTTGTQSAVWTARAAPGAAVTAASASAPACSPGRLDDDHVGAVHLAQPGPRRRRRPPVVAGRAVGGPPIGKVAVGAVGEDGPRAREPADRRGLAQRRKTGRRSRRRLRASARRRSPKTSAPAPGRPRLRRRRRSGLPAVEPGGDHRDPDLVAHLVVDDGAEDDVGVGVGDAVDDLGRLVDLEQARGRCRRRC